jgi:Fe-S cluster assembly protein SufD
MSSMNLEVMHQNICAAMNQYVAPLCAVSDELAKRCAVPFKDLGDGAFIMDAVDFVRQYQQYKSVVAINSIDGGHAVVFVPVGVELADPIQLPSDAHCITLIVGAQAQVIVQDRIADAYGVWRRTITCVVGESARVTFMHEQAADVAVNCFSTIVVHASAHATVEMYLLIMGAAFSRTLISTHIDGVGADVAVRGAYLLTGSQRAQVATVQDHAVAGGASTVDIRGILVGSAHSVYYGTIYIEGQAAGSQAAQVNKNILLGSQCRAHSLPILQVLNNDVHCAHGSAVGQVDELAIFYMQARGVDGQQARSLMLEGFVADQLPRQWYKKVKQRLSSLID